MNSFGILRVAAAAPLLRVPDCAFNVEDGIGQLHRVDQASVLTTDVKNANQVRMAGHTLTDEGEGMFFALAVVLS